MNIRWSERSARRNKPTVARTSREAVETLVGSLVFSLIWAMVLNATLELFHSGGDIRRLIGYNLYLHFPLFALNAAIIWLFLMLVLSITGRLWASSACLFGLVLAVGTIDRIKVRLRMEPVYPGDIAYLKSPQFLFSMVSPMRVLIAVALLSLVIFGVVRLGRIPTRTFRPIRRTELPKWWWGVLGARVVTLVLCVSVLAYAASFNTRDNKLRHAFEDRGVEWAFWYQDLNYSRNGFVAGLLYNLLAEPMDVPPGYSEATMQQVAKRWTREAERMNAHRSGSVDDVNVVFVLSEAFSDPLKIKGAKVESDPIPFARHLMRATTSGEMRAQMYGGGTANMEFEALTGQSLAEFNPQVNTPYQQFVHRMHDYPTLVGLLKQDGHSAIAIHPYMTAMYQREDVYKAFGIEEFIHDTTMHSTHKIDDSEFISDEAAFDEVRLQIQKSTDPLLVNLVTMQNHYPMADHYKDPWPVKGLSGAEKDQLAGYARGLKHTDDALKAFLQELRSSDEKTAVVFYGDHLPAFWPKEIQKKNGDAVMKATPFFVWTNFKTPVQPTAKATSPIYFAPLLFNQLGAKLPPFYALLTRLYEQVPAMEQGLRLDWRGNPLPKNGEVDQLLRDYRLVQYDLSVGKRYVQNQMFYPQAGVGSVQAEGER